VGTRTAWKESESLLEDRQPAMEESALHRTKIELPSVAGL
jgi:hypothetical protein